MKKISIVIPVYNEADQLVACLQAIASQLAKPYEVIVVDNNSTDESAAVARRFDFVKILNEPRQGVINARTTGFNAARGEIIARIDADTILPDGWTMQVGAIFEDSDISAVSGSAHYYDFGLAKIADNIDAFCRFYLAGRLRNANYLWGANMALRRSAWQQIRHHLCNKGQMHEDFDLAIHLQEHGHRVIYDEQLAAGVSSRRIDTGFPAYVRYSLRSPQTYAMHGLRSRRHMYPVILICWAAYLPARLVYRGYDPATCSFSLLQLLSGTTARVDPTANVI